MGFVKVMLARDLTPGKMRGVEANGKRVLLVNLEGKYYAIDNICGHLGCLLSDGTLLGDNIQCICHGSKYDVRTGSIINGPTRKPQSVFQIRIEGEQILVNV